MNSLHDPLTAEVTKWLTKRKVTLKGRPVIPKRDREIGATAFTVVAMDDSERVRVTSSLSHDSVSCCHHRVQCTIGAAQAIREAVHTRHPIATLSIGDKSSYSSETVIMGANSAGVAFTRVASCSDSPQTCGSSSLPLWRASNIRDWLQPRLDTKRHDGVTLEDALSSRLPFASAAYLEAVHKRQLLELLAAASSPHQHGPTLSASVESIRLEHPALQLIHASSLWTLVLEPMLLMSDWFYQVDGDTVGVMAGAVGITLLNPSDFLSDSLRYDLIECDARVVDAAVRVRSPVAPPLTTFAWRALKCVSPLKKLLSFPVGALRHVITSSMNRTLVDEVIEVAQFFDAVRQSSSPFKKSNETTESSASSVRWDELLRAHLPHVLCGWKRMTPPEQDAAENVCVFVGASIGLLAADASNAWKAQRKSTHAKTHLIQYLSAHNRNEQLPAFGTYNIVKKPAQALPSTSKSVVAINAEDDEGELLDGLFDDMDQAPVASGDAHPTQHAAAGVDVAVLHNVLTNAVEVVDVTNESRMKEVLRDTSHWEAAAGAQSFAGVCGFCAALHHVFLHQCPWFIARVLQLHRPPQLSRHMRLDMDKKEADANALPGLLDDFAVSAAPVATQISKEAAAVCAAQQSKEERRRHKDRQNIWLTLARDIASRIEATLPKEEKLAVKKLKGSFEGMVASQDDIANVDIGIQRLQSHFADTVGTRGRFDAVFKSVVNEKRAELDQLYS